MKIEYKGGDKQIYRHRDVFVERRFAWFPVRLTDGSWLWWSDYIHFSGSWQYIGMGMMKASCNKKLQYYRYCEYSKKYEVNLDEPFPMADSESFYINGT